MVVEYELADAVARIYLNRPHRLNAVVPELLPAWPRPSPGPGRTAPG